MITKNDIFAKGNPVYEFTRMPVDPTYKDVEFHDRSRIIYVNASYTYVDSPIGKLIHDFNCKNPDDMFYKELAEYVSYYKNTEEGVKIMDSLIEKYFNELYDSKFAAIKAASDKAIKEKDELHAKEMKEKDELYAKELEESGILAVINALKGMNCNDQTIIDQIIKNFNLNCEKAKQYLKDYDCHQ